MKLCLLCEAPTLMLVCATCEKTKERVIVPARYVYRNSIHWNLAGGEWDFHEDPPMNLIPLTIGRKRVKLTDCYNLIFVVNARFTPTELFEIGRAIALNSTPAEVFEESVDPQTY